MDPHRAQQLVEDDAYAPRAVGYNDQLAASEIRGIDQDLRHEHDRENEEELELLDRHQRDVERQERTGRENYNGPSKGKARIEHSPHRASSSHRGDGHGEDEDEDDDDDILWATNRLSSDLPSSHSSHRHERHRRRVSSLTHHKNVELSSLEDLNAIASLLLHGDNSENPARLRRYSVRSSSFDDDESGGSRRRSPSRRQASEADIRARRLIWWRKAFINVAFILAWYFFSTLLSVYNKWMLSKDHFDFPYPLFVTSVHMAVQWTLSFVTMFFIPSLRPTSRPRPYDYFTKVAPCGVATGLDIGLSNLSLRSITLSFYTMCKSSSLAFVLVFAFLFRLERPSIRLIMIILVITAGVVLMVSTETEFSLPGMIEVLTASALGGLRWSLTQILLDKEGMGMANPIATLFWLAPVMGFTLAIFSMLWDGWIRVFSDERFFGSFTTTMYTLLAVLFPGCLAFAMNVTEFGLIQRTSVVTLSVAGIFKEVVVIFLSMILFGDRLTAINFTGLVVTIFGIALYNYFKYTQFTNDGSTGHQHGHHHRRHSHFKSSPEPSSPSYALASSHTGSSSKIFPRASEGEEDLIYKLDDDDDVPGLDLDHDIDRDRSVLEHPPSLSSRLSSSSSSSSSSTSYSSPYHQTSNGANSNPTHLRLASAASKDLQHHKSDVPHLKEKVAEGQELIELDRKEREIEALLKGGANDEAAFPIGQRE